MPCRNHPHIDEGLEHCEICTETYCADCLVEFRDRRTCGECKAQIVADLEGGLGVGGEGELPPWERRQQLGLVGAFWETSKRVITTPTEFFSGADKRAERWDCLVYIIIVQVLVAIVTWVFVSLLFGVIFGALGDGSVQSEQMFGSMMGMGFQGIIQIVMTPVFAVIGALLMSSAVHGFLVVTKTATRPWHQTMRFYCYAQAPALMGAVLPYIGGIVGGIWAIVTTVIATKRVHGTTTGTAVAAVLWLVVLFMCCGIGIMAVAFGAAASAQ